MLVVDYLQKIPVDISTPMQESEVTTYLAQGLKELAMSAGIRILAVAAADRTGLQSKRMRLHDMRGSSAIQYEADIGAVLNNKYHIVSREAYCLQPSAGGNHAQLGSHEYREESFGPQRRRRGVPVGCGSLSSRSKGGLCTRSPHRRPDHRCVNAAVPRLKSLRLLVRDEKGANLLEFAFIAMFMFTLVAGVVDLGGAYQNYIILVNASREGARLYSRLPCKSDNRSALESAVIDAAVREADKQQSSNVTESLIKAQDVTLSPKPSSACPASGAPVSVTVRHNYETVLGKLLGFDTLPIRASTTMVFYGTDSAQGDY